MGFATVAVYSECDRAARHVRFADEACAIGPSAPADSYLRIDRLIEAAQRTGADALHPGYGFLAENPQLSAACRDAGLTFIGPTPEAIALMGSKTAARRIAVDAGVPVVPGSDPFEPSAPYAVIAAAAAQLGYPVMVKAVAGGGGQGMRVASTEDDVSSAVRAARSEAAAAFGDAAIYLERVLVRPRHIEVQLLADRHGRVVPFVERECSIQRRHQKVVEETPSLAVSPTLRRALADAATRVAAAAGYTGAGTIEYLVDPGGGFYFLEMNTRLQVEHPITEMVTGVDLVVWQIRIACGDQLDLDANGALEPRGHAIECRIYAEDPDVGFLPSPGRIAALRAPAGPWIRDDGGAEPGADVPIFYDPLLSKLSAWGGSREEAIARMKRALREYDVLGVKTTVPFFRWLLDQPEFAAAAFHTGYLDEVLQRRKGLSFVDGDPALEEIAAVATALYAFTDRNIPSAVRPAAAPSLPARADADRVGNSGWTRRGRLEGLRAW
jgi:acetyl-CoA carboxylase biotin carboxylase subunit